MPFRPADIHAHQHLGPVGGVHPARAGTDGDHGRTVVILAVKQGLDFDVGQVFGQLFQLAPSLLLAVLILFLHSQGVEGVDIVKALTGLGQAFVFGLAGGQVRRDPLSRFGVVPQPWGAGLFFQFRDFSAQGIQAHRLGYGLVFGTRFA